MNISKLSEVLENLFQKPKIKESYLCYKLMLIWGKVLGKGIANNTEVLSLKNGKLKVATTSYTWIHQLDLLKERIKESLNKALGEEVVQEIEFLVLLHLPKFSLKYSPRNIHNNIPKITLKHLPQKVEAEIDKCTLPLNKVDEELYLITKRFLISTYKLIEVRKKAGWKMCKKCKKWSPPQKTICIFCKNYL